MRSQDLLLSGHERELLSATLFVITQDMQIIDVWRDSVCRAGDGERRRRSAALRVPPGTRPGHPPQRMRSGAELPSAGSEPMMTGLAERAPPADQPVLRIVVASRDDRLRVGPSGPAEG